MSVFKPNSRHLWVILIFCFHLKKNVAEAHRILSITHSEAALSERTCLEWFQRFKSGDFDVENRNSVGKQKIFEDSELEAKLVPNARRIGRVIESGSTSHFETPQSHGNDLEARKLGSVRVDAERCWTAFLCLWTAVSKTESERVKNGLKMGKIW